MDIKNVIAVWKKHSAEFEKFSGKRKSIQFFEILYYRITHGFSPQSYYQIPLNTEFSRRPLISDKAYRQLENRLNPRKAGVVPFDKWVQYCFYQANQLPSVNTIGFINKNFGLLNGKTIIPTVKNLSTFFNGAQLPIVMKPINGANGKGFDIIKSFNENNMSLTFSRNGEVSLRSFISLLFSGEIGDKGVILQNYIVQHSEIDAFYSNSVNSLRVVTHMDAKGSFSVDCAFMKFGAGNSITDNNNKDGRVFAFMDLKKGVLRKGFTGSFSLTPIDCHPDSGIKIPGYKVPYWRESLELAMRAHSHLPYFRHAGWDIAISPEGPLIIELNSYLAIAVYQKGAMI